MSQDALAAKLQLLGLDCIDRFGISKIEHHIRSVYDYELQIIAQVLDVPIESLYPKIETTKSALEELKVGFRKD